jgi:lipid-A-disaccharide synthase
MKIFMVTGEMSGDKHGYHLAKAFYKICPDLQLYGIGAERMKEAGVTVLADITHLNAFQHRFLPRFLYRHQINKNIHIFYNFIKKEKCDAVVIIGLADDTQYISMKMASLTKELGISIFYYFAPHVWIWSRQKTQKVAKLFDQILTLFPLEDTEYKASGATTDYIGHPVIDEIKADFKNDMALSLKKDLKIQNKQLLVFFPGSRKGEVKYHLPVIKNVIKKLSSINSFNYVVSAANYALNEKITRYFQYNKMIKVVTGNVYELINCADLVITSSGTITLEIALMEKLCIILYKMPWLTYLIIKRIITIQYMGLPNIIMEKEIVPEFLQGKANPQIIAQTALDLLNNKKIAELQKRQLHELKKVLGGSGAIGRAAHVILDHIGQK